MESQLIAIAHTLNCFIINTFFVLTWCLLYLFYNHFIHINLFLTIPNFYLYWFINYRIFIITISIYCLVQLYLYSVLSHCLMQFFSPFLSIYYLWLLHIFILYQFIIWHSRFKFIVWSFAIIFCPYFILIYYLYTCKLSIILLWLIIYLFYANFKISQLITYFLIFCPPLWWLIIYYIII